MRSNRLTIKINKPVSEVFKFTITPPNSTLWINSIVHEETNEWPVKVGTVYKLQNNKGEYSEVTVTAIKENEFIEWMTKDQKYHCRYIFRPIGKDVSELEYREWVDKGNLAAPFTLATLEKLKKVLES